MSWNKCKKCVFVTRSNYSSTLFKVLLTLKILHGSRTGAKGATFEDIAMHMIKHFCLDGDIKSQVLSSLKFGVKMHFIQKKKEKFSLILPASSIHLAPCKFKNEETERIQCIFPPTWYSNVCNNICAADVGSCCGKRQGNMPNVCCDDEDQDIEDNPCALCKSKKMKQQQHQPPPCPPAKTCTTCARKTKRTQQRKKQPCYPQPPCPPPPCQETPSCSESEEDDSSPCYPPPKRTRPCAETCPKIRQSICARNAKCAKRGRPKSVYDDYCQMCPQVDEDDDDGCGMKRAFQIGAHSNCTCCQK